VIYSISLVSCLLINICCQGDGSPDDIHPHFLYKDGNGHSNHNQRATYLSKAIKDNPDRFQSITDILQDICKIVCDILQKHLPDAFDRLRVFCEILPLNHMPVTYPFPGLVLNIQVCTEAHVDANDDTICIVLPFGPHKGSLFCTRLVWFWRYRRGILLFSLPIALLTLTSISLEFVALLSCTLTRR
jgi:hypothetical protein